MNRDFIRVSQVSIAASDDPFSVGRNLESIRQNVSVCLGKLENLNFNLDIKKHYDGATMVSFPFKKPITLSHGCLLTYSK